MTHSVNKIIALLWKNNELINNEFQTKEKNSNNNKIKTLNLKLSETNNYNYCANVEKYQLSIWPMIFVRRC